MLLVNSVLLANITDQNASLTGVLTKLGAELAFVSQQQAEADERRRKLAADMVTLRQAMERQDLELKQGRIAEKEAQSALAQVDKLLIKIGQDRTLLEERTLEKLSEQTTLEKGAQNVLKEAQKLRARIAEKEQRLADLQNEIARIKVDSLNTAAHNKELQATCSFCHRNFVWFCICFAYR